MMAKLLFATLVLALGLSMCHSKPISNTQGLSLFITPQNIKHLASFLHSSVSITEEGRIIHVGSTTSDHVELIRVPLAGPGELDAHTSFKITVGRRPNNPAVDSDPKVGLSDGVITNRILMYDHSNYGSYPPCQLEQASAQDNRFVASSTAQTMQYVLMFEPFHRYGACYTAQEGGYVNTGTFINQLDVSNGVDLIVTKHGGAEIYDFFYFIVETM